MLIKRHKLFKRNGMTLTELVIASALVGVIMIGTASVDYAVRSTKSNAANMSSLAMGVTAQMLSISRAAMKAVGDSSNPPIFTYDDGSTNFEICFRQDSDRNPADYTGDGWICFHHTSNYVLLECRTGPTDPMVFLDCTGTTRRTGVSLLGSFYTGTPFYELVDADGDTTTDYIEFDLAAITDNTAPMNNLTNPMYHMNFRINPIGWSRQ